MSISQIYVLIAVLVLALILVFLFLSRKIKRNKKSRLVYVAIFLVVLGIIFGENRIVGYSLIGAGIIVSIIDIIRNRVK